MKRTPSGKVVLSASEKSTPWLLPSGVCLTHSMQESRSSRWYFGGVSSTAAACVTHPLDLIKVHLQTQQEVKMRMIGMTLNVVRREGFLALYSGLTASLCRQMTYSSSRFAIYETVRDKMKRKTKGPLPFYQKALLAAFGGLMGGFIGTPADLVNVRMQNDVKLAAELRRNYAHAFDGLLRVCKEEGLRKLFSGATMASSRGALVSVGQLACYDQSKELVLATGYLTDNILTHFLASVFAVSDSCLSLRRNKNITSCSEINPLFFFSAQGGCATILCQPLDVIKTRLMNSKAEYRSVSHCIIETAKLGPNAFYKGLAPAGIRLIPHTVLTFIFLEQLKQHFGEMVVT
ncbi:mitochondrial dicarboxylate carrier isoform X1 [Archocentrus centrarchus]|uniref:mitochondrial dicarboxylate carrier isoform X1 n=1 Tax=Archocentrus centrarchus TaxID=63155 RepID=UPI0011EA0A98|nr:mitochondrial dicarboxylate carrier isoform X1 [Archocentrus centrarchus]